MAKILYIHHFGGIGGAGKSLLNYSKILRKKHDITIYCPAIPEDMFNLLVKNGFCVKKYFKNPGRISYYSGSRLGKSFFSGLIDILRNNKYWEDVIRSEDPEIVIVNSMVLTPLGKIIKKLGKKSICVVRETFKDKKISFINSILKRQLNDFFDGVLFISKYDMNQAKLKKPYQKVIYNFDYVDEQEQNIFFTPKAHKSNQNSFNILFLGGYSKLKGTHLIIKALNILQKKYNVKLNIFGYKKKTLSNLKKHIWVFSDYYERKINNYIKKNKLEKYITYHGVSTNLKEAFQQNDVLVFPSTKPHQSRPIFEAGFYKKAFIISDFEQTKEFVIEDYNGLCFKSNDHIDLAKKIEQLILDKNLLEKLGENNYEHSMKYHTDFYAQSLLLEAIDRIMEQ